MTTATVLTTEQYRTALRIAKIDWDAVKGCDVRTDGHGWNILVDRGPRGGGIIDLHLTLAGACKPRGC